LKQAGLKTYPYHLYVPSFGEWGFALAGLHAFEPPVNLPGGLRYLSTSTVPQMFQFPNDMLPVDAEPNRLNDQVLVRYYEHDWREITH
jgi:spermidine synthase